MARSRRRKGRWLFSARLLFQRPASGHVRARSPEVVEGAAVPREGRVLGRLQAAQKGHVDAPMKMRAKKADGLRRGQGANVHHHVKQGETIALVGASGSGKSSIINLLNRFYEYNSGSITIDGCDIRNYELGSLRKNIGVVLQDVFLFSDTIANNISLNNPEISLAQIKSAAKVDMLNVPYKGDAAAVPDLLSGRVHILTGGTNLLLPHVKEGRLRALAALTRTRTRPAPEVPTIVEAGIPNFSIFGWFALFAPAKTPATIVERLEREVNVVLKRPDIQDQFQKIGLETGGPSRQELPAFIKEQLVSWAAAARDAGMQPQ